MWAFGCILYESLWFQSHINQPCFLTTEHLFRPKESFKKYKYLFENKEAKENAELLYRMVSVLGPICPPLNWPDVESLPFFKIIQIIQDQIIPTLCPRVLVFTKDCAVYKKYMMGFVPLSHVLRSISADYSTIRLIEKCLVFDPLRRLTASEAFKFINCPNNKKIRILTRH